MKNTYGRSLQNKRLNIRKTNLNNYSESAEKIESANINQMMNRISTLQKNNKNKNISSNNLSKSISRKLTKQFCQKTQKHNSNNTNTLYLNKKSNFSTDGNKTMFHNERIKQHIVISKNFGESSEIIFHKKVQDDESCFSYVSQSNLNVRQNNCENNAIQISNKFKLEKDIERRLIGEWFILLVLLHFG